MKILIEGNPERYAKFRPDLPVFDQVEMVFCPRGTSNEDRLRLGETRKSCWLTPSARWTVRSSAPCLISG